MNEQAVLKGADWVFEDFVDDSMRQKEDVGLGVLGRPHHLWPDSRGL